MYYPFKTLATFFLVSAAACATAPPTAPPAQVFVVRHLQAQSGSDPGLTAEGSEQARMLARWLRPGDRPRAIYVSRFRRAQETAAPLASTIGVKPVVYDPSDTPALVQAVKAESGTVLVVGHSNTVPDIVEQLGGARPAPIAHEEHGSIWRVSPQTGRTEKLHLTSPPSP